MKKLSGKMSILSLDTFRLLIMSSLIGGVVGALCSWFGQVLLWLTDIRQQSVFWLLFLAPMGMLFVYTFQRYRGRATWGLPLIFEIGQGKDARIPFRLIPFVVVGAWLTHLFGGSAGRVGVAVQMGATLSSKISPYFKKTIDRQLVIVTGVAAGFAGLYQMPIAAIFFSLEVLIAGQLYFPALFTASVASFTASWVSRQLGLVKFSAVLNETWAWEIESGIKMILVAMIFGIVGWLFSIALSRLTQMMNARFPNPIFRVGIAGLAVTTLSILLWSGRYSGLGLNLIQASFNGETVYPLDWLFKLILTVLTISGGYQGGEVTPLFSIGTTLGITLAPFMGLPSTLLAAVGYVSVFGSATNTWLTPIFIGGTVFGYQYIPLFFVTCTVAYLCNGNRSIYTKQDRLFE